MNDAFIAGLIFGILCGAGLIIAIRAIVHHGDVRPGYDLDKEVKKINRSKSNG